MNRKKFIRICGVAAVGLPFSVGLLNSCTSYYYANFQEKNNQLIVPLSEFDRKKETRKFVLLDSSFSKYPICVFKIDQDYVAALMRCTHKGCEINVEGEGFSCPCHGSEFSNTGEVLEGPAKDPLFTFKTKSDEQNLYIQLS